MAKRVFLAALAFVVIVGAGVAIVMVVKPPSPITSATPVSAPSTQQPVKEGVATSTPPPTPPVATLTAKPTLVVSRETGNVSFLAAAWSPDGKRLAVAGFGTQVSNGPDTETYIAILDPKTLAETARLSGHTKMVTELAFVGNGEYLVSVSHDKTFRAWDVNKRREIASLPIETTGAYQMLGVSPDRQWVATQATRSKVQIWDVAKKEMLPMFNVFSAQPRAIAISDGGELLATANETPLRDQTRVSIRLYDVEGNQQKVLQSTQKPEDGAPAVSCLMFSPDASRLFCGRHNGGLEAWDTTESKVVATRRDHSTGINVLSLSPNAKFIATAGGDNDGKDTDIRVWRVADGQLVGKILGPKKPAGQLAWDPTGNLLTFGSREQKLSTWDVSAMVK